MASKTEIRSCKRSNFRLVESILCIVLWLFKPLVFSLIDVKYLKSRQLTGIFKLFLTYLDKES